ncbi:protein transport protein Sec16A isoform X2 [Sabethes cyaneus]|uniref:protein transport protein Sec16A isoform X2 n=1 Tax=Sabethes cyaneus TaxID=53552 RepID=UPI00237D86E4|nr:protein transport protein Sec16A isoform X2 [Sabethes cyaneus]
MAAPFSSNTSFPNNNNNNNNNNDGWGDNWGDWGEAPIAQPKQTQPPQSPASNNQRYFQPQQPYPQHMDQSNRNFMLGSTQGNQQPMSHQNYSGPSSSMQQHFQPPFQHQPYNAPHQQQQHPYVPPTAPAAYFNQAPPRIPSYPSASTPQPLQNQATNQSFNQTISDSFNTSNSDSWNWSVPENQPAPSPVTQPTVESHAQQNALQDSYNQSYSQNISPNIFSLPGGANNTQQQPLQQQQAQPPKVQAAQITRLKNETLSPQWSIESQVSQTSSDRSIESGEIAESRSSNTLPSDDGSSGRQPTLPQQLENYENIGSYGGQYAAQGVQDVPDKLDETLNSLSVKQEPANEEKRADTYRESSFPPPPPSIASNQQTDGVPPPKAASKTPPLPPPPTESGPPPAALKGSAGNPFKRVGQRAHISTPGLASKPSVPVNPNYFYPNPSQELANVENPTPENLEIPDSRVENVENLELAPSNDRNQYLQTGHLSEEGYIGPQPASSRQIEQQNGEDSLPPPGLSRYVPGQQQSEINASLTNQNFPEPPPGLDRMIPGTDLENATDMNMDRQIDGEVSDSASNSIVRSSNFQTVSSSQHHEHHHHIHHHQEEISDRNLYLVPGESDTHHNQQRFIPGVEDDRSTQMSIGSSSYAAPLPPIGDSTINEEQRELVMDGENPHDPPQQQPTHVDIGRNEPIEGENTTDEPINATIVPTGGGAANVGIVETDSNLTLETARRNPSNTSTADESEKDRSAFYGKGKMSRRDEDPLRRSNKSKSSRDRYDTEDSDYSDRERRRHEREGSGAMDRERRRGGDRDGGDKERRKDGGRERDKERDYDYRNRDRNRYEREHDRERDRYRRGDKYDRDSRYETDGSKYETERSVRYEKEGEGGKRYMSREEYYRKREERGGDDRRYRKEKDRDRGDRYRDDRKRDDRYREGGDKRRDRHERRYDYEDYRTGSRNGTDRDRERDRRERDERKERKYPQAAVYGAAPYGNTGYYDPYSYYTQHQQYYEQLRRTNPQAYAEWYRTYYSQIQSAQMQRDLLTSDGRESVHSGRSSTNDKERVDNTDGSLRQDPAVAMEVMEPERLTPRKFPEIHPIVSISCGLLITAKNRLTINGTTDLVKIFSLGAHEPTRKLFQTYPGPLIKDKTHKKSVIEFCEEQLRCGPSSFAGQGLVKSRGNSINSLHSLGSTVNRGSFALLWSYIILLLRQNGTFVGTDISELLMNNKREFPFDSQHSSARSTNLSGRNSSLSATDRKPREIDGERRFDDDETENNADYLSGETDRVPLLEKKEQFSESEITDKFRNYLIYGNITDALEWATENNLWGHALFLASKVDSRQHANVMMKFANKLTLNDPLQTLYQLLSGRTPSAVTCVQDEKWGDWRPHLAMLVSNSSAKPELIKKSITTLGDSLYNRGDLYAAHFCYLLSDVAFGRFSDVKPDAGATITATTSVRLILLGSAHLQRNFKEFSTNESIMMTEIYEYARSLNEERYTIVELQYYKYLLACRMLDYGMQLKCLLYMEQIAEQIRLDPYRFDVEFIKKVYTLGDRLKYYDPVLEKALDESVDNTGRGNVYSNVEDPVWLQQLSAILNNYNTTDASNYRNMPVKQQLQEYSTEQYGEYPGYNTETQQQAQPIGQEQPYGLDQSDINKQFTEINQQLGQLNLQYTEGYDQRQPHTPTHHQYDHQTAAPSYDQGYDSINQSSLLDDNQYKQQQMEQQHQTHAYGYDGSSGQPGIFVPAPVANSETQQHANPYDYWGSNPEMPKPSITMPNAVSNRPGYDSEESKSSPKRGSSDQVQNQSVTAEQTKISSEQSKKGPPSKDNKPVGNTQSNNSGWFGGIWNKLSLKPKNQMILPDDKNPTIVWDPETKRWVNTETDATEEEAFKPPPKMSDIMPGAAVPPSAGQIPMPIESTPAPVPAPSNVAYGTVPQGSNNESINQLSSTVPSGTHQPAPKLGEPTKVPNLQSNMFKMQRNRTLKKSYVDVFNPSGAAPSRPVEPILAPTVPTISTPQGGFFVPGPAPMGGQQTENPAEGVPQFYNPNQYAGAYQQ